MRVFGPAPFALLALTLSACAPLALRTPPEARDAETQSAVLESRVALALHHARIVDWEGIRVHAEGDTVTLLADWRSDQHRRRALVIARTVEGVGTVESPSRTTSHR